MSESSPRPCPWCETPMTNPQRATCGAANCVRLQRNRNSLEGYHRRNAGGERRFCGRDGCAKEIIRTGKQQAWPSYCSPFCQLVAQGARTQARRNAERKDRPTRHCGYCSSSLPPDAPTSKLYCNSKCGWRKTANVPLPKPGRTCAACKRPLPDDARSDLKYCSRPCKAAASYGTRVEYSRIKAKEWREANADYARAWQAAYRAEHRQILMAKNRKGYRENPLPWKNARDKRRLLIANDPRTRPVTAKEWRRVLSQYRGRCAYCSMSGEMTMDHVIPLSRGGRHAIANIVPACWPCNSTKSSRLVMEWRLGKRALRPSRAKSA